ncbi:MAG TPA: DinB family protein, partial [Thermoanaerobaculia bacterium]|nr:DinB family protein [Thermoanaerobaculia bacterium]
MQDRERRAVIQRFEANRRHSAMLFEGIAADAYLARPIPLRQPVVFYEGHFAAFNFNTLVRRALHDPSINPELEELFERGIDPETVEEAEAAGSRWPSRETVRRFLRDADDAVRRALDSAVLEDDDNPLLVRAESVYTILEHEEMHHETLR